MVREVKEEPLSDADMIDLTGYTQPAAQVRWLQKNGVHHFVRRDGKPRVFPDALKPRDKSIAVPQPDFDALAARH